ncbi:MAG: prolipoprotein diacylglyceryl transferase [Clostridia bacterium]|nr:prolipoprotein diacylglyceryl transferase [Clostridia bacterium]
MNGISFPNLGIKEFFIDPVAIDFGGVEIAWYGIIIATSILTAILYSYLRLKQQKIISDHYMDLAIATVVFGVIGTRLFYVLTNLEDYKNFWDIFKVWEGGLAIYGGIIGGMSALIISAVIKKMYVPKVLDCVGPGVMLAQAIGRWGNFMNAEAYGSSTEFIFFGKSFSLSAWAQKNPFTMVINDGINEIAVQPTFFYECVWNLIGFIFINIFYKKKRYDGEVALWYLGWYGLGRMFIEGLRTDSLFIFNGSIKVSQLIGLIAFLVCLGLLIFFRIRGFKTQKPLYLKDAIEDDLADSEEDNDNGTDN